MFLAQVRDCGRFPNRVARLRRTREPLRIQRRDDRRDPTNQ
jgi:hypothetical protein